MVHHGGVRMRGCLHVPMGGSRWAEEKAFAVL